MFVPLSQSCIGGPGCVFSKCDTWGSTVLGNNFFLVQELAANVTHFLCGWKEQKINYKEVLPFPLLLPGLVKIATTNGMFFSQTSNHC